MNIFGNVNFRNIIKNKFTKRVFILAQITESIEVREAKVNKSIKQRLSFHQVYDKSELINLKPKDFKYAHQIRTYSYS